MPSLTTPRCAAAGRLQAGGLLCYMAPLGCRQGGRAWLLGAAPRPPCCARCACHARMDRPPFAWYRQVEIFDRGFLEYAVQFTHELDEQFGLPPKLTMSQASCGQAPGVECLDGAGANRGCSS